MSYHIEFIYFLFQNQGRCHTYTSINRHFNVDSFKSGKRNETTNYSQLFCPTGNFTKMLLESDEQILYETEVNARALKAVLMKRILTVFKIH